VAASRERRTKSRTSVITVAFSPWNLAVHHLDPVVFRITAFGEGAAETVSEAPSRSVGPFQSLPDRFLLVSITQLNTVLDPVALCSLFRVRESFRLLLAGCAEASERPVLRFPLPSLRQYRRR
jgi:hypothetical protein